MIDVMEKYFGDNHLSVKFLVEINDNNVVQYSLRQY